MVPTSILRFQPTRVLSLQSVSRQSLELGVDGCTSLERQCHRRALCDIGEARALFIVERAFEMQDAFDAIRLTVAKILQVYAETCEWPVLALGVHTQRDRRARGKSGEDEAEWRRTDVAASGRDRLVADKIVAADANVHRITRFGLPDLRPRQQRPSVAMFAHDILASIGITLPRTSTDRRSPSCTAYAPAPNRAMRRVMAEPPAQLKPCE